MDKRQFLVAATLAGPALCAAAGTKSPVAGATVLTVTGAIGRSNRGPRDKVLDQLLHKHGVEFERAFSFDRSVLAAMRQLTISPTLEYDGKAHRLSGPSLIAVLERAGVSTIRPATLTLRGIDGYAPQLPLAEVAAHEFIVATHIDGVPMAIGGLGPLWAIHDADRIPEIARKPLTERFAPCPWGLYHIGVQPA